MIYLCAGHSSKHGQDYDPGAVANGHKEADLAVELREMIANQLKAAGAVFKTDQDDWNLNETIVGAKTTEKDVVFDIHFNAATPAATGAEIFIPTENTEAEKTFAKNLLDEYCRLTKYAKRGVKTEAQCRHKRLGIMRPGGMNFLIEICFITNKTDMRIYQTYKPQIAALIAQHLINADNLFK